MLAVFLVIAASVAGLAPAPLTPEGWGEIRVGMAEAELSRRLHIAIPPDDDVNSHSCRTIPYHTGRGDMTIMTEEGRVSRLSVYEAEGMRTANGLGVGSSARQVLKVYGVRAKLEPHAYESPPARYITVWSQQTRRGMRFEIGANHQVTAVHVGAGAIRYVEGCL